MTVAFSGTYTRNKGASPATGTVAITPNGGSVSNQTLDANGHYAVALAVGPYEGFTVVETLDGQTAKTYTVEANDGATVDTSRDAGDSGGGSGSDPVKIGSMQLVSGAGLPAANAAVIAGTWAVGDVYFRTDTPATATQRIYVCTVAGAGAAATWVATAA